MRTTTETSFNPGDMKMFEDLGIPAELVAAAGIERVRDQQAREEFGIIGRGDMSGLVFPYFVPGNGKRRVTCRLRRDHPEIENGRPKNKYMAPYGDRRHLYFPPCTVDLLDNPGTEIVFVEAEKSALALLAWARRKGLPLMPLATGGCWGWRGRIGKIDDASGKRIDELGLLPDLHCVKSRRVYILFDANAATNPSVKAARQQFIRTLYKLGAASVVILDLPSGDWNGPDDCIAAAGDDAMQKVFAKAASDEEWPEPRPLEGPLPPVQPLPLEYLPTALRGLVGDIAERMQVPIDYPAAVAVVALAGCVNRRAIIQPKKEDYSWQVVPNLWGAIVGHPGFMKSPVQRAVTIPLSHIEAVWRVEYVEELADYETAKEQADLSHCCPTSTALDPNTPTSLLTVTSERAIAARWAEWIPWVCLDLRRRSRDGGISSPEFMRLRRRHSELVLDLMRAGVSMRTIRRYRLDDPRITGEVRTMLVAAVKERQLKARLRRSEEQRNRDQQRATADSSNESREVRPRTAMMLFDPAALKEAIQAIRQQVSEHFYMREMRDPDLTVRTNRRAYVLPCQISMYIARQLTGASLVEIGSEFGGKHHTTVLHSINRIEQMRRSDGALDGAMRRLTHTIACGWTVTPINPS